MREFGIGQSVPRTEDRKFLTGGACFVDDIALPGESHAYFLRSPHAHARITNLDVVRARQAPGVIAVFTGDDIVGDGIGNLPCQAVLAKKDGSPMVQPPYPLLAGDRVRRVGDGVVMIVAETVNQAKDASELVDIVYEPLASVTATAEAMKPGAPAVWEQAPDNVCFNFETGDRAAVEAALARAHHVASLDYVVTRVAPAPTENRGAIGSYDPGTERFTLHVTTQSPHLLRDVLATAVLRVPVHSIRVIGGDVGGGFGMKGMAFPEYPLVLWASRRLGRPVKWIAERAEAFVSDYHGRDNVSRASLALDENGRFLALSVETVANMGAYLSLVGPHPPTRNLGGVAGTYTTPAIHVDVTGVFTNTSPTGPYRGAGRPEASYAIERVIDIAAAELGIDRVELRRRNMIPPSAMPFTTALGFAYDTGEFETVMNRALEMSGWDGFEARRAESLSDGKLRGIGLSSTIEMAAPPTSESAQIRFDAGGTVTVLTGTFSHGQGLATTYAQIVAARLGLAIGDIRVIDGDTDAVADGMGTWGSRSAVMGSNALNLAADKIIEKARPIAAHMLEAAAADVEFDGGRFTVSGTDHGIDISEVAKFSYTRFGYPPELEAGLNERAVYRPASATFPNGCHVCEIEIDGDTGVVEIVDYTVVDDVGTMINPLIVEGQIHGGIAQGAGQILGEAVIYAPDDGQLLSGSFMDYPMPRADDFPPIVVAMNPVPSTNNPMGIKGCGEAGTIGALPAVMNAIVDALSPLGISAIDMPATPERIWRAMRDHEAKKAE